MLNTPAELAGYDPRMDAFLARVFDEFGLIACGWSAEWDCKAAIASMKGFMAKARWG